MEKDFFLRLSQGKESVRGFERPPQSRNRLHPGSLWTAKNRKINIVKQLMDQLVRGGIKRQNILFYSFDKAGALVSEIMKQYEQMFDGGFHADKETKYIFLDEIQKVHDWPEKVKYYYDNFNHLKIFLTGSASLFIKKGEMESLAGRTLEYKLDPLGFAEYLRFKDSDDMLENIPFFKEQLSREYMVTFGVCPLFWPLLKKPKA